MKDKKLILIAGVAAALVLGLGSWLIYNKTENDLVPIEPSTNEYAEENGLGNRDESSSEPSFVAQNESLIGKVWYNKADNSPLVFIDGQNFVWYQSNENSSDNALAGTYEFYYGPDAYLVIENRFENGEEPQGSELSSVMILNVLSAKDNGKELVDSSFEVVLFGNSDIEFSEFSYIDMDSLDQYYFSTSMIELVDEEKLLEEVMKDVVYQENTEAWKIFEINFNGKILSYPYSATELMQMGWKCSEINGENGEAYLYNSDTQAYIEVVFADSITDKLSMFDMKNDDQTKLILANGITWGATESEVLSAFGQPNQIARGGINQKIYRYNKVDGQMELYLFTDDANYNKNMGLQQISIHTYIND